MVLEIRALVVVVALAGFSVAAVSCGGDSSDQDTTGATDSQYGVGLELGDVVGEAEVGSSTGPWLVWNSKSCQYEQTEDHPTDYKAESRTVTGGPTQIGYMHYGDVDPFGVANSKSMAQEAADVGFTMNVYNLKYPSETEPLTQARNSVLKKDAGVIQAQQVAGVTPAFLKTLQTEGCIPSVQMYLAVENVPTFGAVWSDVGAVQGTWMAEQAVDRDWDPQDTALVQCTDPTLGEDVNSMFETGPVALRDGGFDLPDANVYALKCEFTPQKAGIPVTDWLTAHPDVKNILMQTIDDERMSGMLNAMKKAGREDDTINIASGTDELGQTQIKNGVQQASIAYFPEKYGEWLIPILEDVMAGSPVPSFVGQALPVITKDNIDEFYPG
jgi:ribose transport system substrate-binding protein